MSEKTYKLEMDVQSDDIEVIIASIDIMRETLADFGSKTSGHFSGGANGKWKLTEHDQCEYCGGLDGKHDEIPTDEHDGEGHIMRGAGRPMPCPALTGE
jgi:hypothetical protein